MAFAWQDILDTEIDGESRFNEALVEKFHDNQECLITSQVDTRFEAVHDSTTSAAWSSTLASLEVYIPPQVATTVDDVTFIIRFEAQITSGTGNIRMRLSTGSWVELGNFTNTSWDTKEIELSSADVKALADSEDNLQVQTQRVSGSGTLSVRCTFGSSRIERAA